MRDDTKMRLHERLQARPLIADGAMGTELHKLGATATGSFDGLNLSNPDAVSTVHRSFIAAGSALIETNTFGANRYKLAEHGLAARVADINEAGVRLAQQAAAQGGEPVLVAGSLGPLGPKLAPYGRISRQAAFDAYSEQIGALHRSGVDLLVVETMHDLNEVLQALSAARAVAPKLPVIASMTFTRDDRTIMGDAATTVARKLAEAGADVIGLNCSGGPTQLLRLLKQMRAAAPTAMFSVMPNAGWPERVQSRLLYPATPDYFGEYVAPLVAAGARIIGGCCGTSPAHISALSTTLNSLSDVQPAPQPRISQVDHSDIDAAAPPPTRLASAIAAGEFVTTVEMDPPKGYMPHKVIAAAEMLRDAGANFVNVADSPLARMRMSAWAVCHLIQQQVGLETVLHFPTRGRNILRVQGDLLAAHALDVRNVFVVMGDPVSIGEYPDALDKSDIVPSGLLTLIQQQFNQGLDHNGQQISAPTRFFPGSAMSLTPGNPEREITLLHRKLKNGAKFALTQPVFDVQAALEFWQQYAEASGGETLPLPMIVGVLPLSSPRHAAFLHNEVPGVTIPDALMMRMRNTDDPRSEGVNIALELIAELRETLPIGGVYLMPPFGRYQTAADIIERMA